MNVKSNIRERTFKFALLIIEVYKFLLNKKEYVMSKQLLKAGTSIGANVEEAQAAQSKKDFVAKMAISSKETKYWLRLLDMSGYLKEFNKKEYIKNEIEEIIQIITKIVKTSMKNIKLKT